MVTTLSIKAFTWMQGIRDSIVDSLKNEDGQDLIEYAVLIGGIGIVAAVAFLTLPIDFGTMKNKIGDCVTFSNACK